MQGWNQTNITDPKSAGNSSDSLSRPDWYHVCRIVLAIITVIGNAIVIYIIASRRRLREQYSPNWFILSLAVADFLVGAYNMPVLYMCVFWVPCSPLAWELLYFTADIFMTASIVNLCVLTFDRYFSVTNPFQHLAVMRPSRCCLLIILSWLFSTIIKVPNLVINMHLATDTETVVTYNIIYSILVVLLPTAFMVYAYTRIYFVVKKHRKQIRSVEMQIASNFTQSETDDGPRAKPARDARSGALASIGVVVLITVVCNLYYLYWLVCHWIVHRCNSGGPVRYALVILRYFNSAPNFFVYVMMKGDFRQELRRMCRRN